MKLLDEKFYFSSLRKVAINAEHTEGWNAREILQVGAINNSLLPLNCLNSHLEKFLCCSTRSFQWNIRTGAIKKNMKSKLWWEVIYHEIKLKALLILIVQTFDSDIPLKTWRKAGTLIDYYLIKFALRHVDECRHFSFDYVGKCE